MEQIATSTSLSAQLLRGRLEVRVDAAALPPESLFGFAERRNPKRAFLFVSKVLGRHIPARPSCMAACFEALAAKIPPDLPGPVLIMGMAETAVGLGAGVHRAYSATRRDSMYLVSTRHPLGTGLFARFEEEHSHASAHLVHMPLVPDLCAQMLASRSLVLVDDELSTGKTFVNLYGALREAGLTALERVVTCVLTDWSAEAVRKAVGDSAVQVSLLKGSYHFHEDPAAPMPDMPEVGVVSGGEWPLSVSRDWGRLGTRAVEDTLAPDLRARPGEKILVVGSGEFVWRPFLLAERLERAGADVRFSSTTRSPIALGHAIEHVLSFPDNYGLGIPNFLYNVKPGHYDRVLICVETPACSVPDSLVTALKAEVLADER